jgi:predicted transcriptional regulator
MANVSFSSTRQTKAYIEVLPKIPKAQRLILLALEKYGELSPEQLERNVPYPIASIRARLCELFDEGYVRDNEKGSYRVTEVFEIESLKAQRLEDSYQSWAKQGEKLDWHFRYDCENNRQQEPYE